MDVCALCLGDVFHCVLLRLELSDFFSLESYLFLQLLDLLLKLINCSNEAERLLKAHLTALLVDYARTSASQPNLAVSAESSHARRWISSATYSDCSTHAIYIS